MHQYWLHSRRWVQRAYSLHSRESSLHSERVTISPSLIRSDLDHRQEDEEWRYILSRPCRLESVFEADSDYHWDGTCRRRTSSLADSMDNPEVSRVGLVAYLGERQCCGKYPPFEGRAFRSGNISFPFEKVGFVNGAYPVSDTRWSGIPARIPSGALFVSSRYSG
jgi:hypothetical protein